MSFQGMDPQQVRDGSDSLRRAARQLEDMMASLHTSITAAPWSGPDADGFRDRWEDVRGRAGSVVIPGLEDRSRILRADADQQDRASAAGDGGSDPTAPTPAIGDQDEAVSTAVGAVTDGQWPRLTELLADGASGLLAGAGDVIEVLTGADLHLAEDGTGYADAPQAVTPEQSGLVPPGDLAAVIQNVATSAGDPDQGQVSLTVVGGDDPTAVIVSIPGTEQWSPSAGDNPLDMTGNAALAGSQGSSAASEATADAIDRLYADQGIPPDTPVMLTGHSQGGMIAAGLAADEDFTAQYDVTDVITTGAPVDNYDAAAGTDQLHIQHRSDVVARLDLEGSGFVPEGPRPDGGTDGTTTVTLPDPAGNDVLDVGGNHAVSAYRDSVAAQLQDPASPLAQHARDPGLGSFLTEDPGSVQHFTSDLHRRR